MPQYISVIVFLPFQGGEEGGWEGASNLNQNNSCSLLQLRKLSTFSEFNFIKSPFTVYIAMAPKLCGFLVYLFATI